MQETYGGVLPHALDILARLECELSKMPPSGDAIFSRVSVLTPEQRKGAANSLELVGEIFFKAGLLVSGGAVSTFRVWLVYFDGAPPAKRC